MKVFLRKDIEGVGFGGEVVKVSEGYARNFLFPRDLAVEITAQNEEFYKNKIKTIENRKEAIATETSMLAEKIKSLKVTLNRKMHDDGKLYGAVSPADIAEALSAQGVTVAKNQVLINKSIKTKGAHKVIIKLTARLQPELVVSVHPE
jgi:large subunit ribosomal protein L9